MKDLSLLALRAFLGGTMIVHGAQKVFGHFGGPGPKAAGEIFENFLGFVPGERFALAAGRTELAGGALVAAGALGPAGPAGVLSAMLVASASLGPKKGFLASEGGIELSAAYAVMALVLLGNGYGRYSFDYALGLEKHRKSSFAILALLGSIAASIGILSQQRPVPEQQA